MFILEVGVDPNPNPNPNPDFDPNPNPGGNGVGGGDPAALRRVRLHQPDLADALADNLQGTGTRGVVDTCVVGGVLCASKRVPVVGTGLIIADIAADCRRVNNTPTASDALEVSLQHYMQEGILTQQQVDRLRTMVDSPDFDKDAFKNLLLEMGVPSESRVIPNPDPTKPPIQILGADGLADQAVASRRAIEVNTHNRNCNIGWTAGGALTGLGVGLTVVFLTSNPLGWGCAAVLGVVAIGAAIGNFFGSLFRW